MHKPVEKSLNCLIVTVSDTRTVETDKSGKLIEELLLNEGHEVFKRVIVKDEPSEMKQLLDTAIKDQRVDIILMTGGTGISKRDMTIEVVQSMLEKQLPGFGEVFRMLSYTEDIGSKAILSRAEAGILPNDKIVFAMPGSSGAVKLAMTRLILKEVLHIYSEVHKHKA